MRIPGLAPCASVWVCRRWALLKLAPPFNFLNVAIQQSRSSYPLSLLKCVSSGVLSASFMTSSIVRRARYKIFVSAQLIGWLFAHACSAITVKHLAQASLCSFKWDSSRCFVSLQCTPFRRCMVPCIRRLIVWLSVGDL